MDLYVCKRRTNRTERGLCSVFVFANIATYHTHPTNTGTSTVSESSSSMYMQARTRSMDGTWIAKQQFTSKLLTHFPPQIQCNICSFWCHGMCEDSHDNRPSSFACTSFMFEHLLTHSLTNSKHRYTLSKSWSHTGQWRCKTSICVEKSSPSSSRSRALDSWEEAPNGAFNIPTDAVNGSRKFNPSAPWKNFEIVSFRRRDCQSETCSGSYSKFLASTQSRVENTSPVTSTSKTHKSVSPWTSCELLLYKFHSAMCVEVVCTTIWIRLYIVRTFTTVQRSTGVMYLVWKESRNWNRLNIVLLGMLFSRPFLFPRQQQQQNRYCETCIHGPCTSICTTIANAKQVKIDMQRRVEMDSKTNDTEKLQQSQLRQHAMMTMASTGVTTTTTTKIPTNNTAYPHVVIKKEKDVVAVPVIYPFIPTQHKKPPYVISIFVTSRAQTHTHTQTIFRYAQNRHLLRKAKKFSMIDTSKNTC